MLQRSLRAGRRGMLFALLVALFLPLGVQSANAADAYRYWSYWGGGADGSWEYAASGPADRIVSDGDVEGWLFLASADAVPAEQPGASADFAELCPDGEPVAGQVRVGVVIDFGSPSTAPDGDEIPEGENPQQQCVTVPEGSTGEQVLAEVAEVRTESGAVCGIAGYPSAGCFELVAVPAADAETTAPEEEAAMFPIWPLVGGLAVLAALIVLLVARNRGQSSA